MISKITEEVASLSLTSPDESEAAVPQGASLVQDSSTPKNTSANKMTKSQRRRRSKGIEKHSFNAEHTSGGPDDKKEAASVNAEVKSLTCEATLTQPAATGSNLDRYRGLVVKGKRKIMSRQEMRALKAAEARASLQSADEPVQNGLANGTDSTPTRACSTPKEQSSCIRKQVKFAVEDSPLLSERKAYRASVTVAQSIKNFCSVSKRWNATKKEGAVNLQNFIGLKIDKDGNLAKCLDYTAMIYLSDFSDVLKSMSAMCDSLEQSLKSIIDLKLNKEVRKTFKPFNSEPLRTIVLTLWEICKGYDKEYNDKRAACTKLMNACFHEDDKEDCTRQLNNIVNIWTTDVHVTSNDPRLETFSEEMKASGWH